ncbi:uncharacterized protein LOC115066039 [Bactrocera dorsalis]|uniref:Uncharacterized protein LOC115066039 n=1 Tax=Bactrocera dorsalis TaxID=27457 RepID=A0ABM3JH11_BACDO|nr:uncharacterized protein LOC115066039 [Bactrocera dorsalis]
MACLFENRKYIENAVRHAKSTLNVSGAQGFASDDEVVVEDGFTNNSAENDTKIFVVGTYIGIFKEDLITVTATERITLTTVMSLLLVISLCGNICSLLANMRRQLRPFFRACLISLAISDLINSTFLTTAYLSQILQEYSQVWLLGRGMCRVVPSITTAAILVSSITLVGIAMDRYFAVMRAVISFWNPGVIFCVLSMLTLWAAAIGTSWPVSRVYELYPVHILTRHWIPTHNTNNTTTASAGSATVTTATTVAESRTTMPTLYANSVETVTKSHWEQQTANNNQSYTMLLTSELVMMCVSDQSSIAMYYFAIFGVIFVPTIIAFIWMNSVIAKQLWKSRRTAATSKRHSKNWWRHLPCICSRKCKDDERNLKEDPVDSKGRQSSCLTISNGAGINTTDLKIPPLSQPSVTNITFPTKVTSSAPIRTSNSNNRETRHLRMFTVIILLITAFLFLRSPTWILMLMRIGGIYAGHFPIILHYFFGILNLTNSMLNPFFYTFLTDILKFAHFIKTTFCSGFCSFRLRNQSKQHIPKYPTASSAGLGEDGGASQLASTSTCCGRFWINKMAALTRSLCCKPAARKSSGVTKLRIQPLDDKLKGDSELYGNERDEGVDCSDASGYSKELDSAQ